MAAHATTNIFYTLIGFWLILGVGCDLSWSTHILTVQTGGSVTIPCYYDEKYTQQKKYWYSEIDYIYRNTTEENLSVIDHPDQNHFTVTMRNLQDKDTGHYCCVVDIKGQLAVTYKLYIKVQSAPDVPVVSSSVSGHEGGNISVQCFYSPEYMNEVKWWCRYKYRSCYKEKKTVTSQNSSVQINDDGRSSFTVLMTGLRLTDSGWYFCSAGQALNPVQLTVIKAEPDTEKDTSETGLCEVTDKPLNRNNELLTVWLPVSAALLLLLILVCVFTWRWRRRPKQDKHQIRDRDGSRTDNTTDMIYSKPEDPVIYSTINDENPNDIRYYSTIDDVPGSEAVKPPAGGAIYSIIYSTVAPQGQ